MKASRCLFFLLLLCSIIGLYANDSICVKLYPKGGKCSNGLEGKNETYDGKYIRNISDPSITVFFPSGEQKNRKAILIIPGGSYSGIAVSHEGYATKNWLNSNGIVAVLLKYRLPNGHPNVPLQDAQEAMRLIRSYAAEWGIDVNAVGIMGFSAGGHLASSLLTRFEEELTRPDFGILVYPVVDLHYENGKTGENLLGEKISEELMQKYSTHHYVNDQTPPTYLVLTDDDKVVPPANSIAFYSSLKEKGVAAELHIYPSGNHGWWMRDRYLYGEETYTSLMRWIQSY